MHLKAQDPRPKRQRAVPTANAVRHGLTAGTILNVLEDLDDYKPFENSRVI